MADNPDLETQEADYDQFVRDNLRHNYIAHFTHGMLGMTGFRILMAPTFLPAYLFALTGSNALVGLGQSLLQAGATISPMISASNIEHRRRVLPVALRTGMAMRFQILGLALAGFFLTGSPLLIATFVFIFLLGFFQGQQRVIFQMLLSKVIPIDVRGRLQAYRNVAGAGLAALISYLAGVWFIGHNVLGNGYATTFLLSFVLTTVGLLILYRFMREPEPPTVRERMSIRERLRDLPELLADRDYRWFLVAQSFGVAARISTPFCILYAADKIEVSGAMLGLLTVGFLGADTLSNLVWGYLGDSRGYRLTFILAMIVWLAALLLLIAANGPIPIFLAFFGIGASMSGYMMSATTMILEFGKRDDLPMRLALSTTAETSMAAIGPLLGGVIAAYYGYVPLFWISIGLLCVTLAILLFRVREPRTRN
ncbi:MFS transporter [Parasphingopyxis marina]|uniref:MFS transporter n=1 Tax=Parasphingopyxis marina TaxID=2761622 RepID=A0A842HXZ4_9SPHN|nr:MFS transporter [Parasphingopyxis marina]MBC2776800.1 MFS transporter [Parasphingopyxis marina]